MLIVANGVDGGMVIDKTAFNSREACLVAAKTIQDDFERRLNERRGFRPVIVGLACIQER